ncbi:hypothetical protein ACIGO9_30065 [Nocardia asteroides]|uniref:hypothetical protein n=1 Tax=Nocardia asteroides TaxID=1824 RepID=UPI0037CBD89E
MHENNSPVTREALTAMTSLSELGAAFATLRDSADFSVRTLARAAETRYEDQAVSQGIFYNMSQGKQIVQANGDLFPDDRIKQFLTLCGVLPEAQPYWEATARRLGATTTPTTAQMTPVEAATTEATPTEATQPLPETPRRRPMIAGAAALSVLLVVAAVVILIRRDDPAADAATSPVPTTVTTTVPPTATPLDQTVGCPHKPPAAKEPAYISIIAWCHFPMFNADGTASQNRQQLKLRPCITNETDGVLDLSITKTETRSAALRLLVTAVDLPGSWNPPPATAAKGDRPVRVNWRNNSYWAIPPNVPGDAALVPDLSRPGELTFDGFSTIWDDTQLTPDNRVFYRPVVWEGNWPKQEADLVFNLPLAESSQLKVFALAIVDPENPSVVIAVSDPHSEWPPTVWGALF